MGLEKSGRAKLSKSGKALNLYIDDRSSTFTKRYTIQLAALKAVVEGKRVEAEVMRITRG